MYNTKECKNQVSSDGLVKPVNSDRATIDSLFTIKQYTTEPDCDIILNINKNINRSEEMLNNSMNNNRDLKDFEIEGNTLVKYRGTDSDVVVPECVEDIGERAFQECSSVTKITIPNGVTTIWPLAFAYCRGLKSIKISESVINLYNDIFYDCPNLEEIIVDSRNSEFYSQNNCLISKKNKTLIAGCANSIIPNDIKCILGGAFWGRSGLKSITIPNSVSNIGDRAFENCDELTSIMIPNSVESIGKDVFSCCTSLEEIEVDSKNEVYYGKGNCIIHRESKTIVVGCKNSIIPDGVTHIGDGAFFYCSGLTSIVIPNGVVSIGRNAFAGCKGLTSITVPDGITSIPDSAFYGCSGLVSITIPESITNIGEYAFAECSKLTSIIFKGTKKQLSTITIGDNWDYETGSYVVHCTDGDIDKIIL